MRAETDQDWQHRREVLRQNDFVRSNEEATKNTRSPKYLREYLSNGWLTSQIAKKLFPLPTISFTLDVPVIINM